MCYLDFFFVPCIWFYFPVCLVGPVQFTSALFSQLCFLSNHLLCMFKPSVWLVFPSFAPYYMFRTSSASDFFLLSLWTSTDTKRPKSILFCMSQDWTKCFTAWLSNVRDIKRSQCVRVPGNRVMSVHLCVSDRPETGPCVVLKVQLVITERSHVNVSIGGKHHTWKLREVDNNRKAEKMNKWETKTLTEEDIVAPVPLQTVGAGSSCSFIKLLQPMSFCQLGP